MPLITLPARPFVRGLLTAVVYVTVVCSVLLIEYHSEVDKFSRGTYTAESSPLFFSAMLTLPSSVFLTSPGYPPGSVSAAHESALSDAVRTQLVVIGVQPLLIGAAVVQLTPHRARRA